MRFLAVLAVFVSFLVAGCAATGKPFAGLETPAEGKGLIYVMRQKRVTGAAVCTEIFLDGENVRCLDYGNYFYMEVEPGQHNVQFGESERKAFGGHNMQTVATDVTVGADETIFIEWIPYLASKYGNVYKFSAELVAHPKPDAEKILQELKHPHP